jgi:hypothetical protein
MEIGQVVAMLIHEARQTERWPDMMKVTGAFCDYANAPKNLLYANDHLILLSV